MQTVSQNPFDVTVLAEDSLRLFITALGGDVINFVQELERESDGIVKEKETCDAHVSCTAVLDGRCSQVNFTFVLQCTGIGEHSEEAYWRVSQKVFEVKVGDDEYLVCWSAPSYDMGRIWFVKKPFGAVAEWAEVTDLEGVRKSCRVQFERDLETPIHPELEPVAA